MERGVSAWRITSGSSALRSTSERVTNVSPWLMVTVLLATERPLCMRSTAISSGASGLAPAGEDGVDRLDRLPVLAGQPRHHGLRQQLPAEDDAVRGAEAVRPVAVGADLLERQCVDERSNREHGFLLWGPVGHHCCITGPADVGPASGTGRDGLREAEDRIIQSFLTATSKSDTLPKRGFPGTSPRHSVSLPASPAVVTWVIRTTRG